VAADQRPHHRRFGAPAEAGGNTGAGARCTAPAANVPAPRPAREPRRDGFPIDGQQSLVVFLRGGVELPDATVSGIGDQVALATELARQLVLRGAAEYVPAPVSGDGDGQ
jgi:hypothetical protein